MHFSPSSITLLFALTLHSLPPASALQPCSPLMSSILNPVAWTLYKQLYCDVASPPTSAKNPANDDSVFGPKNPANEESDVNPGGVVEAQDRFGGDDFLFKAGAEEVDKPVIVVVGHGKPPPPWHKPHEGKPPLPPKRPKPPKRKCRGAKPHQCGNTCVNFESDASNCGRCGNKCPPSVYCASGTCSQTSSCTHEYAYCGTKTDYPCSCFPREDKLLCIDDWRYGNDMPCQYDRECEKGYVCIKGECFPECAYMWESGVEEKKEV